MNYISQVIEVRQTQRFADWLDRLKDGKAFEAISNRLFRASTTGNLGDVKSVGDGVFEMRIAVGPGYRLYFVRRGLAVIILLCGGDKGSQSSDIVRAKRLATTV